jgi:3-hydroxyisobutyrate dehydrogenase-like beta-hydroxyacid dehydrogenase
MGSAIARRLAEAGLELTLWNRTRSRAEELGVGTVVATPAEAVGRADLVITSLTGPEALRAVLSGPGGALASANGQTFVEMSTVGPDVLQELAPLVARTGSILMDAPLVGAPPVVLRGAALVLVGGESRDVERIRPVLQGLGEPRHVGPVGSGARLKLVANSMLAAVVLSAAELEVAGRAAGLDPTATFEVLTRLVPSLEIRRAGFLEDRHEPTLFALRDLRKDLDLALRFFRSANAYVPTTTMAHAWVGEAAGEDGDLDISAVIRRYASSSGSQARQPRAAGTRG